MHLSFANTRTSSSYSAFRIATRGAIQSDRMNCSLEATATSASASPSIKALNLALTVLFQSLRPLGRSRSDRLLENVALRQQINALIKTKPLPRLQPEERAVPAANTPGHGSAPRVGDVPSESPRGTRGDGLLHGAYGNVSSPHRLVPDPTRSPEDRPIPCHRASERALGDAAARESFPYDSGPFHLVFDRDSIFSQSVVATIQSMGIEPKRTAARSPWQNGVAEPLDRKLPARAAGSRGDLPRGPPPATPSGVCRLLLRRPLPHRT